MSPEFRQSRRKHDVVVTQQFRADAPEFPAVFIDIASNATKPRRTGVTYSVPDSFPFQNLHFAEDWGGDFWTVDQDQNIITYARTLDPQMEIRTIIGFEDIPLDMRQTVLEAGPTISILDDDPDDTPTTTTETSSTPDPSPNPTGVDPQPAATPDASSPPDTPPVSDLEEPATDVQRELGALETRVETVEEDIQGFGVFENDLQSFLGDPTDPLDNGQFHEMKQDLEILAELVSEVRTETIDITELQQQLEDLETRIERLQSKFESSRSDLTERLDSFEKRLDDLERAHTESNVNIRDHINTLEDALKREMEHESNQEATPDGG